MRRFLGATTTILIALVGAAVPLKSQDSGGFVRYDAPAIGAPRTIVSADFNRDGFPDIALGGTARASVGILLHHGLEDGDEGQRFGPLIEVVVGGGPFDMVAADLNRDGWPDLAVANADSNAISILLNNRTSVPFNSSFDIAVGENPRGIAAGDFNRDGIPDVVVTKYMGSTVEVLYGDGGGGFPARRSFGAAASGQGVATADFNHDGWTDFVTVSVSGLASFYYLSLEGARREDVSLGTGANVVTAGDFDKNGWTDVAAASTSASVVQILSRTASGPASGHAVYQVAGSPRGIDAADLNNDGWQELVVAGRNSSTVSVLSRTSGGSYVESQYAAGIGARDVALTDFDRDSRVDILTANEYANSVTLLQNAHAIPPSGFAFERLSHSQGWPYSAFAVADFNHNGVPDLLTANNVLLDNVAVIGGFGYGDAGDAADLNRDGHPDIVLGYDRFIRVLRGDGAGGFTEHDRWGAWGRVRHLRLGDMNSDGAIDMVVTSETAPADWSAPTEGTVQVFMNRGDGTFYVQEHITMAVPRWLEVADINRDASLDVAISTVSGIQFFQGNGTGELLAAGTFGDGTARSGFAFGDITEDGRPDLVVADARVRSWGVEYGPIITLARGTGEFVFEPMGQIDSSGELGYEVNVGLRLGDLTGDGVLDIFTAGMQLFAGQGGGQFGPSQAFAGYGSFFMLLADINADGMLDIAGVNTGFNQLGSVLLNTRRQPSENRSPVGVDLPATAEIGYARQFEVEDDELLPPNSFGAQQATDPDAHDLRYRWTLADGTVLSTWSWWQPRLAPGTYEVTLTVDDVRGGVTTDRMTLTITPHKENVLWVSSDSLKAGAWTWVQDSTAASGYRITHPDAGAPKLQTPLAEPTNYVEMAFVADPTQEYKLWLRLKAQNDYWANDSVFVQFSGARDATGTPVYQIGTTSALAVNLEECSNCGISGWGWEDDGWGAVDKNGVTLRFPQGGVQVIRIQTREDGVSMDQIVLSAEKYLTQRPGTAKNDNTKLPWTGPFLGYTWDR